MAKPKDGNYGVRINSDDWRQIKAEAVVRDMGVGDFVSVLYQAYCDQGKSMIKQNNQDKKDKKD